MQSSPAGGRGGEDAILASGARGGWDYEEARMQSSPAGARGGWEGAGTFFYTDVAETPKQINPTGLKRVFDAH